MESVVFTGNTAGQPDSRPDFRHVRNWVFDLDNTLYRADNGIFAQIESRMTDYVTALLKLPRDDARMCQKDLYRRYGTTLNGLMCEHDVDAEDYLRYVHDIDLDGLGPDTALAAAIQALPGRRFVFTNGCRNHAVRILNRLGMTHLFEAVWDIRTIDFAPKPRAEAYDRVVATGGVTASEAAMFDDIPRNLVPARAMGMTTVWLNNADVPWSSHGPQMDIAPGDISHETDNLTAFLPSIRI